MKILVLGASNAIGPAAFPAFLESHLAALNTGDTVVNRSIGASTSNAGLYSFHVSRGDAEGADVAIVDYEVNETGHLAMDLKSRAATREILVSLLTGLRAAGIEPIVTVLPTKVGLNRRTPGELVELAAAEDLGVYRFNLVDIFRRLQAEGLPVDAFMRDSSHMTLATTPIVGRIFAKVAAYVAAHPVLDPPEVPATPARAIAAAALSHAGTFVTRSTSLRTSHCARIVGGDATTIPVAADERLASLTLNVGAEGGTVEFSNGTDRVVKQLVFCWFPKDPDRPLAMTVDFTEQLTGGPEGIRVRILPEGTPITEKTGHQMVPLEGRYGAIEIEGALVLGPAAPVVPPAPRDGAATDLLGLVDLSDEIEALRRLRVP